MSLRHKVEALHRRAARLKMRIEEQVCAGRPQNSYDRAELAALDWALRELAIVPELRRVLHEARLAFLKVAPGDVVSPENFDQLRPLVQGALDSLREIAMTDRRATEETNPSTGERHAAQ